MSNFLFKFNLKRWLNVTFLFAICLPLITYANSSSEGFTRPNTKYSGNTVIIVSGKVTNEDHIPIAGVTVAVKGTSFGVSTDADGMYKINVSNNSSILVFKSIGYLTQEININGITTINAELKRDTKSLEEVVVVGYGSQKRASVTGAVSSVSGKTLSVLPVGGVDQALQGRIAGLTVTNNGSPGNAPIIAIRGISSINFGSGPLYVIDGVPGGLNNVDAGDILSVDVLKDASAAAIYGSRATNGVIIITTKKGANNGRLQIDVNSYVGVQNLIKRYSLLNTQQYVQYATALDGANSLPPRLQPANFNLSIYPGTSQTFASTNTDWQKEYFKSNAPIMQHNIAISGGNGVSRFYTSAGYFDQSGITQATNYSRKNFRINSEHNIGKLLTFSENFTGAISKQRYDIPPGNITAITNVIRMLPYLPVRNPTNLGGFEGPISSFDGSDPANPVEYALINQNTNNGVELHGVASATLKIAPWLKLTSTYGIDYGSNLNQTYNPIYNDGGTLSSSVANISDNRGTGTSQLFTQQLTFDKTFFNDHHVSAVVVYETQGNISSYQTSSGQQSTNLVKTLNGATNLFTNYTYGTNLLISEVARVGYDYQGKYLVSGSIRRDGFSVFAPGHKYANFPAASIGWKVDRENFMKNLTQISELKLRAGYGVTGIDGAALGNYPYQQAVASNVGTYPFNNNIGNNIGNVSTYYGLSNYDLGWEITKQFNYGLDLGLFKNKVTLSAELYHRETDNLILNAPTPPSIGFGGNGTPQNVGSMKNTGFELTLGYHKNEGSFKWDITGIFGLDRNKVLKMNTPTASISAGGDVSFGGGAPITYTIAGQPVQSFYGYVVQGIFQNAADVAGHATQQGAAPGDLMFKDINHDGVIDANDRTFLGSYLPKFTYALNYGASYKHFDLSLFFQGVYGNKIFNAENVILQGMPRLFNASTAVLNAWTSSNTNTSIPRAAQGDPNGNVRPSNRWIEDGSYLRLKNLSLGYNLSSDWLKSFTNNTFTKLRVYVSSTNLLTFTKYTGLDPEIGSKNGTLTNGIDYGQYPSPRVVQLGIQATF